MNDSISSIARDNNFQHRSYYQNYLPKRLIPTGGPVVEGGGTAISKLIYRSKRPHPKSESTPFSAHSNTKQLCTEIEVILKCGRFTPRWDRCYEAEVCASAPFEI